MSGRPRLSELLRRWEDAQEQGLDLAPEALCGDCPELLAPFRKQIAILRPAPSLPDTFPTLPEPTGPLIVPEHEILGELGRGGMGVVYKARDLKLNRVVALKMIRHALLAAPEERERLRREAEAVARLKHLNVVQVFGVGEVPSLDGLAAGSAEAGGCPFFTLEYVEGGSLAEVLEAGPLPVDQAAALTELLARAVHSAHERGIVHRDLKPANVLLQPQ